MAPKKEKKEPEPEKKLSRGDVDELIDDGTALVEERDWSGALAKLETAAEALETYEEHMVTSCVEINRCVGCTRQFFTKSFLGDDAAVLAPSSGEEPALSRYRAGAASVEWRTTRRFSTNAP